ncbi:T52 [Tupaiid betaherpesvirus 1]|uniref:Packaging protein UL32 n=1 Tax=Tupaiid herpesvirus 1 (strain 1) TaxID=10397 RepID=Q91TN6_TUHV1|nr:T52 [Tupaiid betaherpesvirus 1]AAK57101.1 T52 [Tupaiid betaherpesvirus 1]
MNGDDGDDAFPTAAAIASSGGDGGSDVPGGPGGARRGETENAYSGWSPSLTTAEDELTNELLLYAHPIRSPEPPPDLTSASDGATGGGGSTTGDDGSSSQNGQNDGAAGAAAATLEAEIRAAAEQLELSDLLELCTPLEIDKRCNVCAIVSLLLSRDPEQRWLLDYSLLCYKCSVAPRTALSTLITASEFLHLVQNHFPRINFRYVLRDRILTVFDFHIHFFINRCFAHLDGDPVQNENVTLQHVHILRSLLLKEETVPYQKLKRRLNPKLQTQGENEETRRLLEQHGASRPARFTRLLFYVWSGTNVFFNTPLTDLAIAKQHRLSAVSERRRADRYHEIERSTGPIYLSCTPVFMLKNQTTTVCLLCELMACSARDNELLAELRERILHSCRNNLKLVDRIQLTLAQLFPRHPRLSPFSPDPAAVAARILHTPPGLGPPAAASGPAAEAEAAADDHLTYYVLKQVGVTGIYKHFFCDPYCAANLKCTRPEILFGTVPAERLPELKISISCESLYPHSVDRRLWLYAQIFKAFQITKRHFKAKTQLADFLREFTQLLDLHGLNLIEPGFIVDKYV